MSNVNNPHGLMPLNRCLFGGPTTLSRYIKAAAYAYAIYKWDPLTVLAGYLNGPASGITPGTTQLIGVAAQHSLASVLADDFEVYDQPDALFDAQEDNSGAANAVQAKVHYYANLTGSAGGSPTRDVSGVGLSGTSIAVTATLDVKMLKLVPQVDNAFGAYARFEVKINKHLLNFGVTAT